MHDRYFFIAATMLFVLAFLDKRAIWPAILIQITSMISYFQSLHVVMPLAVVINTGIAVWLCISFWQYARGKENKLSAAPEEIQHQPNMRS
jgi:nicotinamide riboside transporter PnuC